MEPGDPAWPPCHPGDADARRYFVHHPAGSSIPYTSRVRAPWPQLLVQ